MSVHSIAYNPAQWYIFFSAQTDASAALTGLLFVAVSINLPKIISNPLLTARAAKALVTLAGVLLVGTLGLVPGQSAHVLGWELLALGVLIWIMITFAERASIRNNSYISRARKAFYALLAQASVLPAVAGGLSLVLGYGGGLYWMVASIIASFVAALLDTWVLLIEILR